MRKIPLIAWISILIFSAFNITSCSSEDKDESKERLISFSQIVAERVAYSRPELSDYTYIFDVNRLIVEKNTKETIKTMVVIKESEMCNFIFEKYSAEGSNENDMRMTDNYYFDMNKAYLNTAELYYDDSMKRRGTFKIEYKATDVMNYTAEITGRNFNNEFETIFENGKTQTSRELADLWIVRVKSFKEHHCKGL